MCSTVCGDDGSVNRSSSSKKLKQKKVPQRGLGVAQLEKIRMEEQQKKDINNNFSSPSTDSPSRNGIPLSLPLPNLPIPNNQRPLKSCRPPSPPPMPINLSSQNPIFRTRSLPNTENFHLGSIPCLSPDSNWPPMWHTNLNEFTHDRNTQQHSSSLVNILSSSTVLNFPMEPPSNQSFYSPLWPDEDKMMVGTKRTCPFPLDNPPIPTFHSKFAHRSLSRSDESSSNGNGGTPYNLDTSIPIFRDIPSNPSAMPTTEQANNSRKISRSENGNSHTEQVVSLASPTTSFPNARFKQICKVSIEDQLIDSRQGGGTSQQLQPNLLSFFPATKLQATASASASASAPPGVNHSSCNSDVAGGSIDLNLKL
ncbi:hypothetical protein SOVF_098450 [Spinacia oleracea]|nr:hypothetical protein SOVF_098450 [Spinacia oleracea]